MFTVLVITLVVNFAVDAINRPWVWLSLQLLFRTEEFLLLEISLCKFLRPFFVLFQICFTFFLLYSSLFRFFLS